MPQHIISVTIGAINLDLVIRMILFVYILQIYWLSATRPSNP
uniref:Uncharacterized protein n=1 Tax=Arundo donax TaxID=35708 RepID=A0A0A9EME0_ARUDO